MVSLRPSVRVARGASYILIQGVGSTIMGVVFLLFLIKIPKTRLSPPPSPEMGIYFILSFLLTLIQMVGTFAFQSASAKYISQYVAQGNVKKARSVISRVLQITLLVSLISSVSLLIFAEQLSWALTGSIEWTTLFRILASGCLFVILFPQVLGFLQGLQKMREFASVNFTFSVVQFLFGILFLYLGLGLFGVLYGWLMGFFLSSLVGLFLTAKFLGIFGNPHPIKPLIRSTFDWEVLWKSSLACICMTTTVFLVSFFEKVVSQLYLFPIYVIVGAIVYFLSLVALKAIKKRNLELIQNFLPERFKRIDVWIGHLASIE